MRSPCPYKQETAGRQKAVPLLTVFLSSTRFQQAGNPLLICSILTLGSKNNEQKNRRCNER